MRNKFQNKDKENFPGPGTYKTLFFDDNKGDFKSSMSNYKNPSNNIFSTNKRFGNQSQLGVHTGPG